MRIFALLVSLGLCAPLVRAEVTSLEPEPLETAGTKETTVVASPSSSETVQKETVTEERGEGATATATATNVVVVKVTAPTPAPALKSQVAGRIVSRPKKVSRKVSRKPAVSKPLSSTPAVPFRKGPDWASIALWLVAAVAIIVAAAAFASRPRQPAPPAPPSYP
jgi:hypothetical protein